MIPSGLVTFWLIFGAYRITRLIGWDDLPPIHRLRVWVKGEKVVSGPMTVNGAMGLTDEDPDPVVTYRRPLLAHFLGCPFCQGFWVSIVVYVAWLEVPTATLYVIAPFALSGLVGLVAKNLDP